MCAIRLTRESAEGQDRRIRIRFTDLRYPVIGLVAAFSLKTRVMKALAIAGVPLLMDVLRALSLGGDLALAGDRGVIARRAARDRNRERRILHGGQDFLYQN